MEQLFLTQTILLIQLILQIIPLWCPLSSLSFQAFHACPSTSITLRVEAIIHPCWSISTLPDGEDTRSGNTGLYFNLVADLDTESPPSTSLNFLTAVAKLGNVPEFSVYQVPGLGRDFDGTVFDVFPGSPAIQDDGIIAFKGNYAIPVEATDGSTVTI